MLNEETKDIAVLSRRDSTDMRTIAIVTLLFLPGTFSAVSSPPNQCSRLRLSLYLQTVFSQSFFGFSDDRKAMYVAPWLWLWAVVTVILTLIVIVTWWLLSIHQNKLIDQKRDLERKYSGESSV